MQPGTIFPVHRHLDPPKKETFVILGGSLRLSIYNDDKTIKEQHVLSQETGIIVAEIMPEEWHSVEILEPNAVILEIKAGPYQALGEKDILK